LRLIGKTQTIVKKEKGRKMKKSLKICICGLMAAVLASGCSAKTDSGSTGEAATTAQEPASEPEAGAGSASLAPGEVVSLAAYKGVSYVPASQEVTDEEVEGEIQALVDANPTLKEVDREAKDGDVVNIDYVGKKDGEAFDGGTDSGYDLTLGSGSFIDGFEDGLVGTKAGQKVNLDLTFPEEYFSEELAGQDVVFEVTVNKVQESEASALTDDFIKENTEYSTVEEYRKAVREGLEEAAKSEAENMMMADLLQKVVTGSEVKVSDEAVQAYYDEQYKSCEDMAQMYQVDTDTIISSFFGMEKEEFEEWLRDMAEEECRMRAVVNAIADAEKLAVEDKDIEDLAESNGFEDTEALIEAYGEDVVHESALRMKVVRLIVDNAVAES